MDGWGRGTTGGSRFALRSATLTRASSSSPPIEYHPPTGQSGSGEQSHLISPSLEGWVGEEEGGRRQNPKPKWPSHSNSRVMEQPLLSKNSSSNA